MAQLMSRKTEELSENVPAGDMNITASERSISVCLYAAVCQRVGVNVSYLSRTLS